MGAVARMALAVGTLQSGGMSMAWPGAWADAGWLMTDEPESDTEDLTTEIWTWRGKS